MRTKRIQKSWMLQNMLQLNDDKTELLLTCPKKFLSYPSLPWYLSINKTIPFSTAVRSLGVILYQSLTFHHHISHVCLPWTLYSNHWLIARFLRRPRTFFPPQPPALKIIIIKQVYKPHNLSQDVAFVWKTIFLFSVYTNTHATADLLFNYNYLIPPSPHHLQTF